MQAFVLVLTLLSPFQTEHLPFLKFHEMTEIAYMKSEEINNKPQVHSKEQYRM